MPQIRLNKTPELEKVFIYLQSKYNLLSEAEIIKMALSEKYHNEIEESLERDYRIKKTYRHLMTEGRKLGDRFLKKKGLKRKNVSEEEFYHLLASS